MEVGVGAARLGFLVSQLVIVAEKEAGRAFENGRDRSAVGGGREVHRMADGVLPSDVAAVLITIRMSASVPIYNSTVTQKIRTSSSAAMVTMLLVLMQGQTTW